VKRRCCIGSQRGRELQFVLARQLRSTAQPSSTPRVQRLLSSTSPSSSCVPRLRWVLCRASAEPQLFQRFGRRRADPAGDHRRSRPRTKGSGGAPRDRARFSSRGGMHERRASPRGGQETSSRCPRSRGPNARAGWAGRPESHDTGARLRPGVLLAAEIDDDQTLEAVRLGARGSFSRKWRLLS
jgi:hypothetical protein